MTSSFGIFVDVIIFFISYSKQMLHLLLSTNTQQHTNQNYILYRLSISWHYFLVLVHTICYCGATACQNQTLLIGQSCMVIRSI